MNIKEAYNGAVKWDFPKRGMVSALSFKQEDANDVGRDLYLMSFTVEAIISGDVEVNEALADELGMPAYNVGNIPDSDVKVVLVFHPEQGLITMDNRFISTLGLKLSLMEGNYVGSGIMTSMDVLREFLIEHQGDLKDAVEQPL